MNELSPELVFSLFVYGLVGYMGGWFFRGDADLRSRYGAIVAFFITYSVFSIQIVAAGIIATVQSYWFTGVYAVAFFYRFFIHHD